MDTRIMLSWQWPVNDQIVNLELIYWEASDLANKVSICCYEGHQFYSVRMLYDPSTRIFEIMFQTL